QVEFSNGIRLDETYYYWPGSWSANNPGMFTGSGLPMRYAKADGTMIDVYQATTQLVDENTAALWPGWVNTLLDNALGSTGYYGAFVVNAHPDASSPLIVPNAVVAAAQAHNVPIISSEALLNFTDGRDNSSFTNLSWNNTNKTLNFTMNVATGGSGLQSMVPL